MINIMNALLSIIRVLNTYDFGIILQFKLTNYGFVSCPLLIDLSSISLALRYLFQLRCIIHQGKIESSVYPLSFHPNASRPPWGTGGTRGERANYQKNNSKKNGILSQFRELHTSLNQRCDR